MNPVALGTIVWIGFIVQGSGFEQVSSTAPRNFENATSIGFGVGFLGLKLSHNSPEIIRKELLDTNTVRLIVKSSGLSDEELATVQVAEDPEDRLTMIYQIGKSDRAFNVVKEQLGNYIQARDNGHTRAYCLAAITNHVQASTISDPALRAIATDRPYLPVSWLKKAESDSITNKAGKVSSGRWVAYALVDGEIAWRYIVRLRLDGSMDVFSESKCDAKEYDPKYQKTMKALEDEIDGEMKRDGSFGRLGSVHTFWHFMKKKLKAKGIEWRSPAELNPQTSYD